MTDIQAVIFDCDGTLVDSELLSIETLILYASEYGLRMEVNEAVELFAGGQLENAVAEMELRIGRSLPEDFIPSFRKRQAAAFRDRPIAPVDGAVDLLRNMRLPYCLASNAPQAKIALNLELTRLDQFFRKEQLFSADDRQIYKPEPDLFLRAAEFLNVAPDRCAVVEDSPFGVEAGIKAGMHVFVYTPHGPPRFHTPEHAELVRVIRELRELSEYFC